MVFFYLFEKDLYGRSYMDLETFCEEREKERENTKYGE